MTVCCLWILVKAGMLGTETRSMLPRAWAFDSDRLDSSKWPVVESFGLRIAKRKECLLVVGPSCG